jgi:hypothetical protein
MNRYPITYPMIYIGSGAQDNPRYYLVKHITVKPHNQTHLKDKIHRFTYSHITDPSPFFSVACRLLDCRI